MGKIKGADGKACWKGYKYAGTKKGKDKCVPIKKGKKGVRINKKLTDRQLETLEKHKKHHTKKHMKYMYNSMIRGNSFSKAHVNAQKKVGT